MNAFFENPRGKKISVQTLRILRKGFARQCQTNPDADDSDADILSALDELIEIKEKT